MKTTFSQAHDLYQIMELERDATPDDIRRAYRKIVLEIHPDRNPSPDAHERTAAVNEAYEILKDPNKRRLYDLQLMWQRPGARARSERARRSNPEPRQQQSHRRRDQDSPPETRTDTATGVKWRRARNGNGWIIQTARCRAWVGHKAKRTVSSNIFLHDKYQQDAPTQEAAQSLAASITQAASKLSDIDAVITAVSAILDQASRSHNIATGTRCRVCRHGFHEPQFASCYGCH